MSRFFLYAIKTDDGEAVKIGVSRFNDESRLDCLQPYNHRKLEMLYMGECGINYQAERRLHEVLADFNIHGEWFDYTQDVVKCVVEAITIVGVKEFLNRLFPHGWEYTKVVK